MYREFFFAASRWDVASAWLGLLVVVGHSLFSAWLKYAINGWYTKFYDLLQTAGNAAAMATADMVLTHHNASAATVAHNVSAAATGVSQLLSLEESRQQVWLQMLQFFWIVLPAVIVHPIARWIRSHWTLRWRLCLMRSYMDAWNPNLPPIEGASQRLHEDTQRFSKGVESYLAVLLNSLMTLAVFTPILFNLGVKVQAPSGPLQTFGRGWMFAAALMAAVLGLGIAMFAGRHLVGLEVANQRVEALLRREAVVLETTPGAICEPAARQDGTLQSPAPYFVRLWAEIRANYTALFANFLGLNLWLDCFDQVMVLAPYVLVAPRLFSEDKASRITLGTLVQTSNSFDKVFASLSIISENWGGINEWRSTYVRLRQFESELRASGSAKLPLLPALVPGDGGRPAPAEDEEHHPHNGRGGTRAGMGPGLASASSPISSEDAETPLQPLCGK